MWMYFNDAFVSVVEHQDDSQTLLVRSRFRGHLENLLPGLDIHKDTGSDYPFRVFISRRAFANVIQRRILDDLNYTNFKASIPNDTDRATAFHVYGATLAASQTYALPPPRGLSKRDNWADAEDDQWNDLEAPLTKKAPEPSPDDVDAWLVVRLGRSETELRRARRKAKKNHRRCRRPQTRALWADRVETLDHEIIRRFE